MSAAACLAIWFGIPVVAFPLVEVVRSLIFRIVLPAKDLPNDNPLEHDGWWTALLRGGFIGFAMCAGPTYGSTNEQWQYSPANAGFAPFPIWWLLVATTLGGVLGAAITIYLQARKTKPGAHRGITNG